MLGMHLNTRTCGVDGLGAEPEQSIKPVQEQTRMNSYHSSTRGCLRKQSLVAEGRLRSSCRKRTVIERGTMLSPMLRCTESLDKWSEAERDHRNSRQEAASCVQAAAGAGR